MYPEPGSNRHGKSHWFLRPARLPVPPLRHARQLFYQYNLREHIHPSSPRRGGPPPPARPPPRFAPSSRWGYARPRPALFVFSQEKLQAPHQGLELVAASSEVPVYPDCRLKVSERFPQGEAQPADLPLRFRLHVRVVALAPAQGRLLRSSRPQKSPCE